MGEHRMAVAPRRWRGIRVRILAAVVAALGAVLAGTGAAAAYWGHTGSGSGTATSGTLTVTVNSVTPATTLYPGGSTNLIVNVTNPSSVTVQIASVSTLSITAACTTPAVTYTSATPSPTTIAPGTHVITLTNALAMGAGASDDCQGKAISVQLKVAVQK
jgi:hypothetical protein